MMENPIKDDLGGTTIFGNIHIAKLYLAPVQRGGI